MRVGGIISVQVNGVILNAKGKFTYNFGRFKRKTVFGTDGRLHGHSEEAQPGFIEGAITDDGTIDTTALADTVDATVTLQLANGKTAVLYKAVYTHEGTGDTEEGEFPIRFEGEGEELAA
jgi:hypothetical protein